MRRIVVALLLLVSARAFAQGQGQRFPWPKSSATLRQAYAGGATSADSVMTLDSTRLGVALHDGSPAIGVPLLSLTDNGGSNTYFSVSAAAAGAAALLMLDGASAPVSVVGQGNIIYNNTTHTFQISTNGGGYASLATGTGLVWPIQNGTATNTFNYGGTMTGSSVANQFASTNGFGVGDIAVQYESVATPFLNLKQSSSGIWDWTSTNANIGLVNSTGDGIRAQGANNVYIYGAGATQVNWLANNGMMPLVAGMYNGKTSASNFWAYTTSQHFTGAGTAPTKAAGACIGGTQTVTLDANASDAIGTITLTGTATGTASATCATVTFNNSYANTGAGNAPHCQLSPANAAASALSGAAALFIDSASTSATVFVIKVGATALVAGTYIYTYDCTQ